MEQESYLCGNDHLISYASTLHPFANPLLTVLILVVGRRVKKVASITVEMVQDLEGGFFAAFAHPAFPCFAEVHRSKA